VALYGKLYTLHGDTASLTQFVKTLIVETGYEGMLREEGDYDAENRLDNLDGFLSAVADYEARTSSPALSHFLEQITLDTTTPGGEVVERPLPMMTLHLAKGLEFPYVFIVGLEEKLLPHVRSLDHGEEIEEERRLLYVGMTRAMKGLWLSHTLQRYAHGREEHNLPSRFIEELPREVLARRGLPQHFHPDSEEVVYLSTAARSLAARGPKRLPTRPKSPVSSTSTQRDPSSPYAIGRLVRHPQFGRGVIRGMEGDHDNPKVTILFENGQMKRLLGKYANLEVL
jgi:DNA helicase-2/ATP-dependent DNA helicase PcrA